MIREINIDGKTLICAVLGEKGEVCVNDYRKTIMNMFEMASLWDSFAMCLEEGEMWTAFKIIQAFGLPEEEGGEV